MISNTGQSPNRISQLSQAKACWVKSGPVIEGRSSLRIPFSEPLVVTPWTLREGAAGPSFLVGGRDVSTTGLAFWHSQQIPWTFVAVSLRGEGLDDEGMPPVETMLVRLLWCRFLKRGTYLSGGCFESVIGEAFGRPFARLLGEADVCLRWESVQVVPST